MDEKLISITKGGLRMKIKYRENMNDGEVLVFGIICFYAGAFFGYLHWINQLWGNFASIIAICLLFYLFHISSKNGE